METFTAKVERIDNMGDGTINVYYLPENPELQTLVGHGADLNVVGTIAETAAAYLPTAETEMFAAVDQMFPNMYQRQV